VSVAAHRHGIRKVGLDNRQEEAYS
jgi:hypothetical protein